MGEAAACEAIIERCGKCQGLLVSELGAEYSPGPTALHDGVFMVALVRCVNCGCRYEGTRQYGNEVGTLVDGKKYGAVHQTKVRK